MQVDVYVNDVGNFFLVDARGAVLDQFESENELEEWAQENGYNTTLESFADPEEDEAYYGTPAQAC